MIISNWDTRNETDMTEMFVYASTFNQNFRGWKVDKVLEYKSFVGQSSLTCDHTPRFEGKDPATTLTLTHCKK